MKYLLLFIMSLLFSTAYAGRDPYYVEGNKIIDKIYSKFAVEACQKYDLYCEGDIASFPKKIECLGGMFVTKRRMEIPEMRLIILNLMKDFQKLINEDVAIRSYLVEYPFPAERIDIILSLCPDDKAAPDEIDHGYSCRKRIFYKASNPEKSMLDQIKVEETIEEACKKADFPVESFAPLYSICKSDELGRIIREYK